MPKSIQYAIYDLQECKFKDPMTDDLKDFENELVSGCKTHESAAHYWITTESEDWDTVAVGALLVVSLEDDSRILYDFDYKCEPVIKLDKVKG